MPYLRIICCAFLLASCKERQQEATQAPNEHPPAQPTAEDLLNFASRLEADGDLKDAEWFFERAIEHDLGSTQALRAYAHFLSKHGRMQDALLQWLQVTAREPDSAKLQFELALCLASNKLYTEALRALDKAIKLDAQLLEAHYERALLLHQLGRSEQALADLAFCREADSQNPDYDYLRALIYKSQGKFAEALHAARLCLERDEKHAGAQELIQSSPPTRLP